VASSISSAVPAASNIHPVDAAHSAAAKAAGKVADIKVANLTLENWESVLQASPEAKVKGPEEWMVFVTGGNATCYGMCENATRAWNESLPILAASPTAPKLAFVDCDAQQILCNHWAIGPPTIYHMLLPAPMPDQSKPATTVRSIGLNRTSVTASDIYTLHTKNRYLEYPPYEGAFHPFNGWLKTTGAIVPLAYVMWALAKMPSWLPMIGVSFLSRSFMGRRAQPGVAARPAAAPAAR